MKKRVICVRTCIVREGSVLYGSKDGKRTITSPEEAAEFAASFFNGSDNYCHVDMAQIYKTAIISNAAGIICFHNHPSGSIEPSKDDRLLTEKMKTAGRYLDIPLRDHIIIGGDGAFYSFNENEEETENSYE